MNRQNNPILEAETVSSGDFTWYTLPRGVDTMMMMANNSFFKVIALRIASLASGTQPYETTRGNYRNLVRQYAQEIGNSPLGEASDEVVFGPLELLCKRGYLELKKLGTDRLHWWDFSEIGNVLKFVAGNGFTMKLTPLGREQLSELEEHLAASRTSKQNVIGFHASS